MRNIILLIAIMSSFVMAQFGQGTISAGSLFSYSSHSSGSEGDDPINVTTIGNSSLSEFSLMIKPAVNYFILDNLSVDGILSLTKMSSGDNEFSFNLYGAGATYYMSNIYGGGGFVMSSSGTDDYSTKSNWLEFHGGYLHSLTENVFLDLGVSYFMGTGESVSEWDGEEDKSDNEESILRIGVGVKAFFNLP